MRPKLSHFILSIQITTCISRSQPLFWTLSSHFPHIRTKSVLTAPKSNDIQSAISFPKRKLHPNPLASALDSVSDVSSATAIFRWSSSQNFQHTAKTYAHMIRRLGLSGSSEEMEVSLNEMVKSGFSDLDSSLGFLVETFCTNQRSREALKVFGIAMSANLRLLRSTCNLLLRVLVSERGNFDFVMYVYKEMVKAEILPDIDTLNYVIKGLCEVGRLDSALIQFYRMKQKNCSPDSLTFELIIGGLCSGGRIDEAVDILNQMLLSKCHPKRDFYARIIPLFCCANKIDESFRLFKLMKDDGICPDLYLYSALIKCLAENLHLKDAVQALMEMTDLGIIPQASSFVHIVNVYCKLRNFYEAADFLNGTTNCPVEPYHVLLSSFCDLDRLSDAIDLLEEMLEKSLSDDLSWNIIISRLCKKGDVRKAFEVICRMIVFSFLPDNLTYSSLIIGYCRNAKFNKAFHIFKRELVHDMSLDIRTCSELIVGLCYLKKVEEAAEVFYHIASTRCSPSISSLNILIDGFCEIGKVDEAIKIRFASCNGARFSSATYTSILVALLKLKKERDILPVLAQMFVEGCTLDRKAYCILINGLCIIGRTRVASDLFNKMVDEGVIPEPNWLEMLIEGFAKCFILKLVAHSLEKLIEAGVMLGPVVCNVIISSLLKEGDKFVACKFLDWMLEKGWVPDPYTHGLLLGNIDSGARVGTMNAYDADTDSIGDILAEGLDSRSWY